MTDNNSEWAMRYQTVLAYNAGRNGTTVEQEFAMQQILIRAASMARSYGLTLDMIKERLNRTPEDRFYCPPDT